MWSLRVTVPTVFDDVSFGRDPVPLLTTLVLSAAAFVSPVVKKNEADL